MIRWGILGASRFAAEHMAPAIVRANGGLLRALASRRGPAGAAAFLELAPGLEVYGEYTALLADPSIDAVYIPLPNTMHADWSQRAAAAGKHVLCEKPVALHVSQVDELIAARDRYGRVIAEALMIAHHPQWARLRRLIESGAIGTLRHMQVVFCNDLTDRPLDYRFCAALGGGALADLGVYILGSARLATGQKPTDIRARAEFEHGVDVDVRISAQFPGWTYDGWASIRTATHQELTVIGSHGCLRMNSPFLAALAGDTRVELTNADGRRETFSFNRCCQYTRQVEAFHLAIGSSSGSTEGSTIAPSASFPCPLEFSRGSIAIMDRIRTQLGIGS